MPSTPARPLPSPSAAADGASHAVTIVLALTAAVAVAGPAAIVAMADRPLALASKIKPVRPRIIPPTQMPAVEPMRYVAVSREDAVAFNATVPFSGAVNPPARPFTLAAPLPAQDRAVDCLAAAQLYEAGDDAVGQRAVAQVIINRVRHPAFPKTICGVVFEGSERSTGCQFTFTCDGALARYHYGEAAWLRARLRARAALSGAVYQPVGHATHYHTNWVVPYWSASLDKVAAVGTHLFFRWTGWWGTPPAFTRRIDPNEPVIIKLAADSPAHQAGAALAQAEGAALTGPDGATDPARRAFPEVPGYPNTFIVTLDKMFSANDLPALAAFNCGDRDYCKFMVWTDPAQAARGMPLSADEMAAMSFSYFRDRTIGYDKPLWNCGVFARPEIAQCMRRQMIAAAPAPKADGEPALRPPGNAPPHADKRVGGVMQAPRPAAVPPAKP